MVASIGLLEVRILIFRIAVTYFTSLCLFLHPLCVCVCVCVCVWGGGGGCSVVLGALSSLAIILLGTIELVALL